MMRYDDGEDGVHCRRRGQKPLRIPLVGLLLAVVACDGELCLAGKVGGIRCEGEVLIHCPGGWMNFDLTAERIDCSAKSSLCSTYEDTDPASHWCIESLGTCDPKSFKPYCHTNEDYPDTANLVRCVRGHIVPSGPWCKAGE